MKKKCFHWPKAKLAPTNQEQFDWYWYWLLMANIPRKSQTRQCSYCGRWEGDRLFGEEQLAQTIAAPHPAGPGKNV